MNRARETALLVSLSVALLMILVPPWVAKWGRDNVPIGYAPIFLDARSPEYRIGDSVGARFDVVLVDVWRLGVQLVGAGMLFGWLYVALRRGAAPKRVPCPICGELIIDAAVKCRFCQSMVNEEALWAALEAMSNAEASRSPTDPPASEPDAQ